MTSSATLKFVSLPQGNQLQLDIRLPAVLAPEAQAQLDAWAAPINHLPLLGPVQVSYPADARLAVRLGPGAAIQAAKLAPPTSKITFIPALLGAAAVLSGLRIFGEASTPVAWAALALALAAHYGLRHPSRQGPYLRQESPQGLAAVEATFALNRPLEVTRASGLIGPLKIYGGHLTADGEVRLRAMVQVANFFDVNVDAALRAAQHVVGTNLPQRRLPEAVIGVFANLQGAVLAPVNGLKFLLKPNSYVQLGMAGDLMAGLRGSLAAKLQFDFMAPGHDPEPVTWQMQASAAGKIRPGANSRFMWAADAEMWGSSPASGGVNRLLVLAEPKADGLHLDLTGTTPVASLPPVRQQLETWLGPYAYLAPLFAESPTWKIDDVLVQLSELAPLLDRIGQHLGL